MTKKLTTENFIKEAEKVYGVCGLFKYVWHKTNK